MNRRGFLGLLAGAAAAPLVPVPDLEVAVGRRIFLPPRGGWRGVLLIHQGNTLLSITDIVRESQRILHEEMRFVETINRQYCRGLRGEVSEDGGKTYQDLPRQQTININFQISHAIPALFRRLAKI